MTRRLPWSRGIDRYGTRAFQLAACTYIVFSLLDWETTAVALARGGREGNAVAASLDAHFGILSLFAFKGIVVGFILAVLVLVPRRLAVWVTTAFAAAVALTVVGNLHALLSLGMNHLSVR